MLYRFIFHLIYILIILLYRCRHLTLNRQIIKFLFYFFWNIILSVFFKGFDIISLFEFLANKLLWKLLDGFYNNLRWYIIWFLYFFEIKSLFYFFWNIILSIFYKIILFNLCLLYVLIRLLWNLKIKFCFDFLWYVILCVFLHFM